MKKYLSCFFVLILFLTATFSVAVCDDEIPSIRVGVYENIPKIFTNEEGIVTGFWPDLVKYIFAQEGWQIEWVSGTWAQCLKRLKTGEINMLPDTAWTEPRSREYTFSNETVLVSWSRLYVPKNSKINSFIDLNGKTIAGLKGSFNLDGPEGLKQLLYKFNLKATIKEMESYEQVFEALQEGKIDAGITNKDFGNLRESDYAVKRTSLIFQPARMQFAFTKNFALMPFLNEKIDVYIKKIKANENSIYYQALEQYIGGKRAETFIEIIPEWIKMALAIGFGVIFFLGAVGIVSRIQVRRRTFELQKSEQKFSNHIQSTPVGVIFWDLDFKTIEWNPAAESIFGYSKVEVMGKHVTELILSDDIKELVDDIFQDLISEKGNSHSTNENITRDGRRIICDWHNTTLKNVDGKTIGVASMVHDVTESKYSEMSLINSEQKWRNILVNIPQIGITLNTKAKITFVNAFFLQLTGWEEKEVIGQDWFDMFIPENVRKDVREVLLTVMSEKDTIGFSTYENEIIDRSGMRINVAWSNALTKDVHGNVTDITCLGVDLTERQRSEQALKRSEEKYRSMMESMKDASYICSSDLHIEYMNPAMIDRVETDGTGKLCYKTIYDRDEKCSWCVFDQIEKGKNIDYEMVDPKDNRYYSVSNSPIFHTDSAASQLTIFYDITEIKDIEAQLRQSRKMESIGTLAGGIAHDFNNLLYIIFGNAEMALEDIPKWSPAHTSLEEIKSASLRAAGIAKQLLNFTRKTEQEMKQVGAVTVIKDALKLLRSTLPTTIDIQKHLPDKNITILADPVQINQVMMNLCINASQAMEETGGILEIIVKNVSLDEEATDSYPDLPAGDYLKITVNDTGPGIGPEIIERIFDPYFTTKKMGKGSGMGLSIVHGIVKNHNGAISVDSKPGKGTTFSLLFPAVDEKPEIEIKTINEIPRGHETILFVDDEKSIANMTQKMLKRLGYKVETRLNPLQALDLFQSKPEYFDLVITDMTMPQMTGAKLSEKLMETRSNIPVIICTGHSSLIDEEKAKQLGIASYIMKPVSMSTIAKAIRKVLDK